MCRWQAYWFSTPKYLEGQLTAQKSMLLASVVAIRDQSAKPVVDFMHPTVVNSPTVAGLVMLLNWPMATLPRPRAMTGETFMLGVWDQSELKDWNKDWGKGND